MTLDSLIHSFSITFSAGTTSEITQEIIEGNFERRAKNKYRPKNAKIKASNKAPISFELTLR